MKRLVCVVEGKGDVEAVPTLCSRILHSLQAHTWFVDDRAIRCPRGKLVDMSSKGPARPCKLAEVTRVLDLAAARKPAAILVLCDADDECPGAWATSMPTTAHLHLPVASVMAVREYESWLLWALDATTLTAAKLPDPERVRDAKGALARIDPNYQPSIHQLPRTRALDIKHVTTRSRSFNKLVRELARLSGRPAPKPVPPTTPQKPRR